MSKREETLAKNTLVFAIGNIASKLLQVLLVPFYTRVMTGEEFGTVDLLQAAVSLLLPISVLSIFESVFRFAMEKDCDRRAVLSIGLLFTALGSAVMCLAGLVFQRFLDPLFVWLVIANTAANALWTLVSQYTKAVGKSGLFSAANVLMTFLVLLLNILFLVVFRMGVTGYMLGYTLSALLATLFLIPFLGKDFAVGLGGVTSKLVKQMLFFSVPLVLNGICWWISSFTDRIMITAFLGTEQNGIYAAASKVPNLLSVIATIFYQAWQISANEEFGQRDGAVFYSETFQRLSAVTFLLASGLTLFCRPINAVFLGAGFSSAWKLMPPLIIMTTCFAFCQFLNSVYSANKDTRMALVTNLICVIVNVILNWFMIPRWGAYGAAVATAVSYVVLFAVRVIDTRRILPLRYDWGKILGCAALLLLQCIVLAVNLNVIFTYIISAVAFICVVLLYRKNLMELIRFAFGMLARIKNRRTKV